MNTPTVVDADLRRGEPLWRETSDGHVTTLVVTDAGLLVIEIEPATAQRIAADHKRAGDTTPTNQPIQRAGTKQAMLIALLQAPEGGYDGHDHGHDHGRDRLAGPLCRCPDYANVRLQVIVSGGARCEGVGIIP